MSPYIPVLILLHVCPHTTIHVCTAGRRATPASCAQESYQVSKCPHTAILVPSYYYICVLILLYLCPHTTTCVSSYCYICPHTTVCVLQLLYMCPHTIICVLILLYKCPHTAIIVSSYHYLYLILPYMCPDACLCFLRLLYMCPHTIICVLILLYTWPPTAIGVLPRLYVSSYV